MTFTNGLLIILSTAIVRAIQGFHLFTLGKIMKRLLHSDLETMLGLHPRIILVSRFTLDPEYLLVVTAAVITICAILFFLYKKVIY